MLGDVILGYKFVYDISLLHNCGRHCSSQEKGDDIFSTIIKTRTSNALYMATSQDTSDLYKQEYNDLLKYGWSEKGLSQKGLH